MFNKFKIGEVVICCGIAKISGELIYQKGVVTEKDYYYQDYYVKLKDGTEEIFSENDIYRIDEKIGG